MHEEGFFDTQKKRFGQEHVLNSPEDLIARSFDFSAPAADQQPLAVVSLASTGGRHVDALCQLKYISSDPSRLEYGSGQAHS